MDAPLNEKNGTVNAPSGLPASTEAPRKSDSASETGRSWRVAFLVFCAAGVLLSADLLRLHVRVHTDTGYHSYCTVNEYLDCESVAFSDYAVFAGLPVALWGMLGYLFMGGLCIWGLQRRRSPGTWPFGVLAGLSLFSVAVGLLLFSISHFMLASLCIVCTAANAVNLILFGLAIMDLGKRRTNPFSAFKKELGHVAANRRPVFAYLLCFAAAVTIVLVGIPDYWNTEASTGPGGLLVGKTPEGSHWIGARRPVLEIVEFSDYQCPFCSRAHAWLRSQLERFPKKIRLVHRHFPLRYHRNSLYYAGLAHCAGRANKFWEANDYLFANGRRKEPITAEELAAALRIDPADLTACMSDETARQHIAADMEAGLALGIEGTPTFVIGDKHYPGRIPEKVFQALRVGSDGGK